MNYTRAKPDAHDANTIFSYLVKYVSDNYSAKGQIQNLYVFD